jgi:hypothetical protein
MTLARAPGPRPSRAQHEGMEWERGMVSGIACKAARHNWRALLRQCPISVPSSRINPMVPLSLSGQAGKRELPCKPESVMGFRIEAESNVRRRLTAYSNPLFGGSNMSAQTTRRRARIIVGLFMLMFGLFRSRTLYAIPALRHSPGLMSWDLLPRDCALDSAWGCC